MQIATEPTAPGLEFAAFWACPDESGTVPPLDPEGLTAIQGRVVLPRIALVDDDQDLHQLIRDVAEGGHFTLAGSYYNATEALGRLPALRPDVVFMDIRLPDLSGNDCTGKLKAILPGLPVVILTGYPDTHTFFRSLIEGAEGFLVKPVSSQEFIDAVAQVLKGDFVLSKQVVPFLIQLAHQVRQIDPDRLLTLREEEILACLFEGMQDKEIALRLGIGTATVHTHMHCLFGKLEVHSRRELIRKFLGRMSPQT